MISHEQYFASALGKDEAYCIAAMSMITFWNRASLTGDLRNIPGQLYHVMKCDLLNQIDLHKTRSRREVPYDANSETGSEGGEWPEPLADSRDEPEQQVLQSEWNRKVRDCLQHLGAKERQVIQGFFFRQLSVTEIAREMHCTPACVSSTKRNALYKLRKIFEKELVV